MVRSGPVRLSSIWNYFCVRLIHRSHRMGFIDYYSTAVSAPRRYPRRHKFLPSPTSLQSPRQETDTRPQEELLVPLQLVATRIWAAPINTDRHDTSPPQRLPDRRQCTAHRCPARRTGTGTLRESDSYKIRSPDDPPLQIRTTSEPTGTFLTPQRHLIPHWNAYSALPLLLPRGACVSKRSSPLLLLKLQTFLQNGASRAEPRDLQETYLHNLLPSEHHLLLLPCLLKAARSSKLFDTVERQRRWEMTFKKGNRKRRSSITEPIQHR